MTDSTAIAVIEEPKEAKPVYEIPEEISRTMPQDKYLAILTKGDYSSIYGTPAEGAFLFLYSLRKGYNPWNSPYQFILQPQKNGPPKAILYAKKEAAVQRKALNNWTVTVVYQGLLRLSYTPVVLKNADASERVEMIPATFDSKFYEVVCDVHDASGKFLEREVGVYEMGADRTPTMAITRAKRRAILAAAGESTNDESEFDSPPRPASRTQETPQRREPSPEPPKSLPQPSSAQTASLPSGATYDTRTGEVVGEGRSVAPRAQEGPLQQAGGAPASALPPLPRKLPPSRPPTAGK